MQPYLEFKIIFQAKQLWLLKVSEQATFFCTSNARASCIMIEERAASHSLNSRVAIWADNSTAGNKRTIRETRWAKESEGSQSMGMELTFTWIQGRARVNRSKSEEIDQEKFRLSGAGTADEEKGCKNGEDRDTEGGQNEFFPLGMERNMGP